MDSILIPWNDGNGNIVISGEGGDIKISSDTINEGLERQQLLTFKTDIGSVTATLTVTQKGNRIVLRDADLLILRDSNGKILTVTKKTARMILRDADLLILRDQNGKTLTSKK